MRNLSTRAWMLLGAGALVIILVVVAGLILLPRASAEDVAQDFADALPGGKLESAGWVPDPGEGGAQGGDQDGAAHGASVHEVDEEYRQAVSGLGAFEETGPLGAPSVSVSSVDESGEEAFAHLEWSWPQDERTWDYTTGMRLVREDGEWSALYEPAVVHPDLEPGAQLRAHGDRSTRGKILGADDEVLSEEMPVVHVGIEPRRMEDPEDPDEAAELTAELGEHLDIDADALAERVKDAAADAFVPVITLRRDDYDEVSDDVRLLPGTVFQEDTQPLNRTREFAAATLGSVGEATAEDIEDSEGRYTAGDVLGRSGLNRAYDDHLRGEDTVVVQLVPAHDEDETVELTRLEGRAGDSITTTLDVDVQDAADSAVADSDEPAALVALRPSDSHVLAVANHDPEGGAYDRALSGRYPPGSIFKVASGLAMLREGTGVDDMLACPETATVDGRAFTNAGDLVLGEATFAEDFTESCNTAFVEAGTLVDGEQLASAAADLGLGGTGAALVSPDLETAGEDAGLGAFVGEVPVSDDPVTHAAMMIGQGQVEASPLGAAVMAASTARGERIEPVLVTEAGAAGEGSRETASAAGTATATGTQTGELEPEHIEALQDLMGATVTDGTAAALADVPGEPVHGKTGTAEYGEETPPRTHSWFIGYQDDLAVAVLVEDGGSGAEAAVPMAEDFLRLVND